MKRKRRIRLLAGAAVIGLVGAFGAGTAGAGEQPPAKPADNVYKVGTLLPQTGDLSILGPPMVQGVRMAIAEINAAGGVNGQPAQLVEQDDGTSAEIASTAVDTLLQENVDLIVGAAGSSVTLGVIDKITGSGVVECSPSNTGVQFTTYPDKGYYFRTAPPDNLQSQVLANLIVDDGNSDVVIVAQSTEYGEGFARFLRKELRSAGASVLGKPILYDAEATSFDDVAETIKDRDPEAVAIISYAEGGAVMTSAIEQGVGPQDVQWYGADGIQSSTFYENVDPNDPSKVEGLKGSAPSSAPADGEKTFGERFEAFAPGTDALYSGHNYDCVVLGALAATAAKSDSPAEIQKNIVRMTKGGTKCSLYTECVALLNDGKNIDYQGAAGPLEFTKKGEPGRGQYDTWEFGADGGVEILEESISAGRT